ncbi:CAP domain-containing protein [Paraphysoderma sedebokerense]|nr:CAP domain-containing protein [Paraphysoderma sedebokerense]
MFKIILLLVFILAIVNDAYGLSAGLRVHRLYRRQGYSRPVSNDEIAVLNLVNQERRKAGLKEVCLDPKLMDSAFVHSQDQAISGKMAHDGSDGSSPFVRINRQGYQFRTAGENVAFNYGSPQAVMDGWMKSPGHRANILNPDYTQMGIAGVPDSKGQRYWTQNFAAPSNGNSKCPNINQAQNPPPKSETPPPPPPRSTTSTSSSSTPNPTTSTSKAPSTTTSTAPTATSAATTTTTSAAPTTSGTPPRPTSPPSYGTQPSYGAPPSYGRPKGQKVCLKRRSKLMH